MFWFSCISILLEIHNYDKAELLQLNRTQFPSLGIFVSKKVGNRKKLKTSENPIFIGLITKYSDENSWKLTKISYSMFPIKHTVFFSTVTVMKIQYFNRKQRVNFLFNSACEVGSFWDRHKGWSTESFPFKFLSSFEIVIFKPFLDF